MRLNHNLASLNIYMEQSKVLQRQSVSLGRISSGLKFNSAKDDPNAISQSERLRMQIRGLQMASKNAQDGIGMLQNAEGALDSINDGLLRIRELVVQASNGTNAIEDKSIIQGEINQILNDIDETANNNKFNGVKLLSHVNSTGNPADSLISMPTGANVGDKVDIPMFDVRSTSTSIKDSNGNNLTTIDVTKPGSLDSTLKTIDDIKGQLLSINSTYGAIENRFESTFNKLNELSDKMEGADSSIRDADVAEEMVEYSKDNILAEAGNALMAQANRFPQDILKILENIRR